jgi:hypothetical protein
MKKNIIYIGDSFCASYQLNKAKGPNLGMVYTPEPTHLNMAADALDLRLYAFGYAGRSWFYSRSRLMETLEHYPDLINDAEAVVFFHTDAYRYNTVEDIVDTSLGYGLTTLDNKHLEDPFRLWKKYLLDPTFQTWAQLAWFKEINELFSDTKKIHFNVFADTLDNLNYLTGLVYRTPLMPVSLGELVGTDKELLEQLALDQRHNHFNQHNNQAIADLVVNAVKTYHQVQLEIDVSKFEQVNPNAVKYPNPGFGTQ